MASYTMQLREYVEMFSQTEELPVRERIEKGRTKLFDFPYPIFDETYRKVFETHFIRTFYMREIGAETEGLFKFNLETWLVVNMPYYNKLFESELLEYDPLTNAKMEVKHTKTNDKNRTSGTTGSTTMNEEGQTTDTANGSLTTDDFSRHIGSDTPDNRLALTANDGEGVINYASEIDETNENNKHTTSNTSNGTRNRDATTNTNVDATDVIDETEDFVQSRVGKIGVQTYPKLIQEYREALLRIEQRMFDDMQQLFMLVY